MWKTNQGVDTPRVVYLHIFTSSEYFCIGTDQCRRQLNHRRQVSISSVAHLSTGTRVNFFMCIEEQLVVVFEACLYLYFFLALLSSAEAAVSYVQLPAKCLL